MNLTPPIKISPLSPTPPAEAPPPDGTEWRCKCGGDLFGIWYGGVLHVKYKERTMVVDGVVREIRCRRCGMTRSIDTNTGLPVNLIATSDDDYLEKLKATLTVSVKVDATDAAIKLALDKDIDLAQVKGTGKDGRITRPDVEVFISQGT